MTSANKPSAQNDTLCLIEVDAFPFEFLSAVAKRESWRKEIYRPVYHVHKWWAKRLGSVFRGILLGCLLPENADLKGAFYEKQDFSTVVVLDPFMGSGTTIGEAHKLGCTALGRDLNPVACESVRVALGPLDRRQLLKAFSHLSSTVGHRIRQLYQSQDKNGQPCDVLYYFWVKQAPCPHCNSDVDLFSSYVFARNAYPERKPEVQVCCQRCGSVFQAMNHNKSLRCPSCKLEFNPHAGPAKRTNAVCPSCSQSFPIAKTVRATGRPPTHRLYAKLVLTSEGEKQYLSATSADLRAYDECSELLQEALNARMIRLPDAALADGYNTRQAIGYNYDNWRDFFNDRQLLALGWLQESIATLPDVAVRDALLILFSGILEFNNLFASYKGEGTGAVRHMFAHHILKPERMPIEANVWGTRKSSGSFSTLFQSRILRALEYRASPFEVKVNGSGKAHGVSAPFSGEVHTTWPVQGEYDPRGIYLSCGSSDETGLPDRCLDFIATDPPFFDNVHYSELADFFFSWQKLYPRGFVTATSTTRDVHEVQDTDACSFATKLKAVFAECHRILKDNGLLVFTYHHSRAEGWTSVAEAVLGAGFSIINAHPVKSEMSVAMPKSQAKDPIHLDMILICKKQEQDTRPTLEPSEALAEAAIRAHDKLVRLKLSGIELSRNDRRITITSQFLATLGPVAAAEDAVQALLDRQAQLEDLANRALDTEDARPTQEFSLDSRHWEQARLSL